MQRKLAGAGLEHRPFARDRFDHRAPERIAVERSETLDVLHVENDAGETGIHDR